MPKIRTYTTEGYLEIQWDKPTNLVCVVSGKMINPSNTHPDNFETHTHQFTSMDVQELEVFDKTIHSATRQLNSSDGLESIKRVSLNQISLNDFRKLPYDMRKWILDLDPAFPNDDKQLERHWLRKVSRS